MTVPRQNNLLRYIHRLAASQKTSPLSDQELVQQFVRSHDEAAFQALMKRHGPMVWAACQRVLPNSQDAEDAFQATWLTLARKANQVSSHDSIAGWLYTVAYRLALTTDQGIKRRRTMEQRVRRHPSASPLEEVTGQELLTALDEELARLPDKYRSALVLCYLEEKSREEAARQLGCPLATLKSRLRRGRALMRAALARRGLTLSSALFASAVVGNTSRAAVPAMLARSTLDAAMLLAAGGDLTGTVSAHVLTLSTGATLTMTATKLKIGLIAIMVGVLVAGAGLTAWGLPQDNRPTVPAAGVTSGPKTHDDKKPRDQTARIVVPSRIVATVEGETNDLRWSQDGKIISAQVAKVLRANGSPAEKGEPGFIIPRNVRRLAWEASSGKQARIKLDENVPTVRVDVGPDKPARFILDDPTAAGSERSFTLGAADGSIYSTARSADGRLLAIGTGPDPYIRTDKKHIHLIDTKSHKLLRSIAVDTERVNLVQLSPDGKTLYASWDELLFIWDTDGKLRHKVNGASVFRMLTGEDGVSLFCVENRDGKGSITCRDPKTGKLLKRVETSAWIGNIALSPDRKLLATAQGDKSIGLFDASALRQLAKLDGHTEEVYSVAFSPDGKRLASGGADWTVRMWDLTTFLKSQHFGDSPPDSNKSASPPLPANVPHTAKEATPRVPSGSATAKLLPGQNVLVSSAESERRVSHIEVVAAADLRDPKRLLAASMSDTGCRAYLSEDAGRTWTVAVEPQAKRDAFDPVVGFGRGGSAYFGYITHAKSGSLLFRSVDQGKHWDKPVAVDATAEMDRPYLAIDGTSGKHAGRVYWSTRALKGSTTVAGLRMYVSDDGGRSFKRRTDLKKSWNEGVVVMSDGTVACLVSEGSTLAIVLSSDGGQTFGDPHEVCASFREGISTNTGQHILGLPQLAAGPKDDLYIVWSDPQPGGCRVMFTHSTDKGSTWSKPHVLAGGTGDAQDSPAVRRKQVAADLPALAVSRQGIVGVCWNDDRDVPDGKHGWDIRFSASLDGGQTFLPSVRVTDVSSIVRFESMKGRGHTAALAADAAGIFHPVWVDNRTGVLQVWSAAVSVKAPR